MLPRVGWGSKLRCGVLGAATLIIAGCVEGGGNGCGPFSSGPCVPTLPEEPSISNLRITPLTPERPNTVVRYSAEVFVVDFQNDVLNGTCEIALSVGTVAIPITSGSSRVTCPFTVTVSQPTQVTGTLTVIDREGHRSSALSFVLGIGP